MCLPRVPPIGSSCLVRGTLIPIFRRKMLVDWHRRKMLVDWHGWQTTDILRQLLRTRGYCRYYDSCLVLLGFFWHDIRSLLATIACKQNNAIAHGPIHTHTDTNAGS